MKILVTAFHFHNDSLLNDPTKSMFSYLRDSNAVIKVRSDFCECVPVDVILHCIVPFLYKREQYRWLSLCKALKPLLITCRTLNVVEIISNLFDAHLSNACTWQDFVVNRSQLLNIVGCESTCPMTNSLNYGIRKLRLHISLQTLLENKTLVIELTPFLSKLCIIDHQANQKYLLPVELDNPTPISVERWLMSFWIDCASIDGMYLLDLLVERVAEMTSIQKEAAVNVEFPSQNPGSVRMCCSNSKQSADACVSIQTLRGVDRLVLRNDKEIFVQLVSIEDTGLRSLSIENCTQAYASNILSLNSSIMVTCSHTLKHVELVGLTLDHIDMLEKIQKLVVSSCKIRKYPVPTNGKGQDWTLSNVDVTDVSSMSSLHRFSLIDCNLVSNISMLGGIKYLTIKKCSKINLSTQYPSPTGRMQDWTFIHMNMKAVEMFLMSSLYQLTLNACEVNSTIWQLAKRILLLRCVNISCFNEVIDLNICYGKPCLLDKLSLQFAVNFWCKEKVSAEVLYGEIETWNVCKVTDMSYLFRNKSFNCNISHWNVSKVTDMCYMFKAAASFNQPLNSWNVSKVTDMSYMFKAATSFNQPLDSWNVSKATDMSYMFKAATSFNQPLDSWNVSNVTRMRGMFDEALSFNQPLDSWNVSKVIDMCYMFKAASSFNQPLDSWNVSQVTDMFSIFRGASAFNQPLDSWNVSNVTNMYEMFQLATSFNQPLESWDVSKVTNLSFMFYQASSFNQPLDSWNVSNITRMRGMFDEAKTFNQPLDSWNVSQVTDMCSIFRGASAFNQPLDSWNVSNVTNMYEMFQLATSFNQPLESWDVSKVTNLSFMFYQASSFNQPLDSWNVSKVIDMCYMFKAASSFNQPLDSWNVSKVTYKSNMFDGASSFNQPLDTWNVSSY